MKILIVTPTLDLSKPYTATPFLMQLYKGFQDEGHELFIIPYSGKETQSFWWYAYPNPNYLKSTIMEKILSKQKTSYKKNKIPFIPELARLLAKPNLNSLIEKILSEHEDIAAVLFISIPLNQINGIPTDIKKIRNIPVLYYDLDVPTSLPSVSGSLFDYYPGANLGEFDAFM
ncbi:MAG: hypothetical protein KGL95_02530, partial [Patescibacteria group bacterium]|nr:hypothetical protein [Patescibacteria group bacterium]